MRVQLGDVVRFRVGRAPDAMKGRERDLGTVVVLISYGGPEPWPEVQFDGYRTAALAPGLLEVVGEAGPAAGESPDHIGGTG